MTGKQRLKVLANYLVSGAVDDEQFDMTEWPKCAIGEGTRIPSLEKEGFVLEEWCDRGPTPQYGGEISYGACAKFFAIPYEKASVWFGPTKRSAATVGRQLLRYLRKR